MISEQYPKGYPVCRDCDKVLEDCFCIDGASASVYFPEVGETRFNSVTRVVAVLGTSGMTPLQETEFWEEVRNCKGSDVCLCVEAHGEMPVIFVVRGSQMFRLKWPELPPSPNNIIARPNLK